MNDLGQQYVPKPVHAYAGAAKDYVSGLKYTGPGHEWIAGMGQHAGNARTSFQSVLETHIDNPLINAGKRAQSWWDPSHPPVSTPWYRKYI
jgi:hypothetical protein